MSLLLAHGHAHAAIYPIGMVWVEAGLVIKRVNALKADQAVLTQMAVSSLFSTKSGAAFKKALRALHNDG